MRQFEGTIFSSLAFSSGVCLKLLRNGLPVSGAKWLSRCDVRTDLKRAWLLQYFTERLPGLAVS
jgi:hypothetical protein